VSGGASLLGKLPDPARKEGKLWRGSSPGEHRPSVIQEHPEAGETDFQEEQSFEAGVLKALQAKIRGLLGPVPCPTRSAPVSLAAKPVWWAKRRGLGNELADG
jgi:hypothetical protein